MSCNLGIKHRQHDRRVKMRKVLVTNATSPQLYKCECGHAPSQHRPLVRSTHLTRSREQHVLHAQ
eukprot:12441505-Prorocentrum_lima.AAC.1